jgi:hypothetical protein
MGFAMNAATGVLSLGAPDHTHKRGLPGEGRVLPRGGRQRRRVLTMFKNVGRVGAGEQAPPPASLAACRSALDRRHDHRPPADVLPAARRREGRPTA